ncbi:hypothetical protein GA0111570_10145 [Raineyella antarctica]|uniref:Uncharacterized protein n=1 Tax=Raineyella antarctica TaxID=1577474 RepID=A0A1G6GF50_9ACTN|nr:hypothetical protein [Raineyella antarctica]SDB79776.1 hypothetical protein GA0111570_10145 [Raineyella antarctica]
MKRLFLASGVALALVPLLAPPAMAAKPNIYHTISSTHGSAVVSRVEGCELTEVFVSSSAAMYAAQPGPVNKQGLTSVFVRVTDTCASARAGARAAAVRPAAAGGGAVLFSAEGQNMAPLVADSRLTKASVSDVIKGTDDQENPVTITLHASWTGTGPLEHTTVRTGDHYADGNVSAHDNNLRRDAVAEVSVTVTGEGTDLSVTGTDQTAVLERVKSMCIEVPRPGVTEFYPCFGFPG